MVSDYNIPMTLYDKLLFSICEEYDEKFKRLVYIVKHVAEERYILPKTINDTTTLRMGGVNVYIKKAPADLFDIEYWLEFRLNYKQFVKFVNSFMINYSYYKFNFDNYIDKVELYSNLENYIANKYKIDTKIYQKGGYLQFDIKVFIHPKSKIIYVE